MADFTSSPMMGAYDPDSHAGEIGAVSSNRLTTLTNVAGAVVSLVLVAGIGVWGYKLLVRDVTGIPVVRAIQGDMRVRPEEPGGELAQHQGLSVNVVAAEGSAGQPADQLRLAPRPIDLLDEDQPIQASMVAQTPQQITTPAPIDAAAAIKSGNVDDLVAQLTDGVAPMEEVTVEDAVEQAVSEVLIEEAEAAEPLVVAAVLDAPGIRHSLRPRNRPANAPAVVKASMAVEAADSSTKEIDADSLPVGTRLAQLGAFDSPEVAREQWTRLQGRFGAYLQDKDRIVQKATSGGRVFYRLRAMGFEDIADARRFCSALVAENADCIPVVTR